MKWLISIAATFFVIVIAISVFLAPDSLVDCGDTPSGESGCQKADAIIAVSGGDTQARTEEAIALYQKFGFKNVAVRKRYYSNGEDAYLMIKELEG